MDYYGYLWFDAGLMREKNTVLNDTVYMNSTRVRGLVSPSQPAARSSRTGYPCLEIITLIITVRACMHILSTVYVHNNSTNNKSNLFFFAKE